MIYDNYITKANINRKSPSCPQIHDHPYIIIIAGGSASGNNKTMQIIISLTKFITQLYLAVPEDVRLNCRYFY